jgi:ABC-type oligopeptide transport system substrate-binding subunit
VTFVSIFFPLALSISAAFAAGTQYNRVLSYFPSTLSPRKVLYGNSTQVLIQVAEGLVKYDKDLIVPGLAEKFSVSVDGRVYRFDLRADLKFSDGSILKPEDIVTNLEFTLASKSEVWDDLSTIKGAKEFHFKKKPSVAGIRILDGKAIEIELTEQFSPFLSILASSSFVVLPKASLDLLDSGHLGSFLSSGPYVVETWVPNKRIVLRKNEYYYNKKNVYFERVV